MQAWQIQFSDNGSTHLVEMDPDGGFGDPESCMDAVQNSYPNCKIHSVIEFRMNPYSVWEKHKEYTIGRAPQDDEYTQNAARGKS